MSFNKSKMAAAFIAAAGFQNALGCSEISNSTDENAVTVSTKEIYTDITNSIYETIENTEIISTTENITNEEQEISIIDTDAPFMESHMSFQGRHVYKNDIEWLVQSGSAAEFNVTGTNVSIVIAGDSSIFENKNFRPRYAVYVDDKPIRDKIISSPEENLILFEEHLPRTANVKIVLLSEAMYGAVGIKSINVEGGSPELISPLPKKDLAIEFIGDSITCGYGVEAESGEESFSTSTENFYKSYAYIASNELCADYSVVAYSGYGVISGYSSGYKNDKETLPQYYDMNSQYTEYDTKHDFSERNMDAVVINLGTNDTCYVNKEDKASCSEFTAGYVSFLKTVRKNNPDAVIICTVGLMGGNETIYPLIKKAVEQFNDDKVTCFLSKPQNTDKNGSGAAWHPSAKTQEQYGHIIAEEIKKALGE